MFGRVPRVMTRIELGDSGHGVSAFDQSVLHCTGMHLDMDV